QGVLPSSAVPANIHREQSALIAVSLLLCQSPRLVRSQEFARAFIRWYQTPPLTSDHARPVHPAEADGEAYSESPGKAGVSPAAQSTVDAREAFKSANTKITTQD